MRCSGGAALAAGLRWVVAGSAARVDCGALNAQTVSQQQLSM